MRITSKNIVYIGFILIIFKYNMSYSLFSLSSVMNTMLMLVGIVCFLPNLISYKYSIYEFVFLIVAIMYSLLIMKINSDDLMLLIFIFCFGLWNTDKQKLLDIFFIVTSVSFICIVIYSICSGEGLTLSAAYREENVFISRYTLGYSHPNSLQGAYLRIVASFVLSSFCKTERKKKYILLEVLNIILFGLSNSRAGFVVISIILLLSFFNDIIIKIFKAKFFYILMSSLVIVVVCFTIYATYNYYNKPILIIINKIITGRFQHANVFTSRYAVSLLGTNISELSLHSTLDCGIISTLLSYGIIGFSIVLFIYLFGVRKMWQNCDYINMIVVLSCVIYSVIESIYMNPFVNIGMLTCIYNCVNRKSVIKREYDILLKGK